MKKLSLRILVCLFALVLLIGVMASCGKKPDTTTTTKTPDGTTTAAQTTTAVQKKTIEIELPDAEATYTGSSLASKVAVKSSLFNVAYTYKKGDQTFEKDQVINVGVYTVTATFTPKSAQVEATYETPEPMTATLTIKQKEFVAKDYKPDDLTKYFYEGCSYELPKKKDDPKDLTVKYTMEQIENGGALATPVPIAEGKATAIGKYRVTVSFTDANGNYTPASLANQVAVLTVRECPNQVLKFTPTMDGKLDEQYKQSAHFTTIEAANKAGVEALGDHALVMNPVMDMGNLKKMGATANIYYLWDNDYVYVCVVVEDETNCARGDKYTMKEDPWVNDAIELYYFFGGYTLPEASSATYPLFPGLTTDSLGRGNHEKEGTYENKAKTSAIPLQKSLFYDKVLCAATHEVTGTTIKYTIEYAFPAKTESVLPADQQDKENGKYKYQSATDHDLKAGEFAFIGFQLDNLYNYPLGWNDATDVPDGEWPEKGAEDAKFYNYVSIYGNRANKLKDVMIIQFSSTAPETVTPAPTPAT